ncbi:hypothetical protein C9I28_11670 [Pseudoduganella armeniaca]|uniref:T6SS Tle3 phospholipase effector alpha/beta domain-containing protein n=1 Tax=Pseudoduganella armeniaca TaxID=2072590 RepID=A0A2R4C9L3_9BURK|nr:hypothetical protein [Pseudoduganella armeniaca]AVR96291.1 hypothetical protein C9I28_11670 [Pseudoduganella armeniaca]
MHVIAGPLGSGVDDTLFLWLHVQHINPTNDRIVFSCPPRAYYVMAALRLARLIESIRNLQPDTPITIVCHSQGNMVAIAAAFLGNELKSSKTQMPCVADTYVLCNPPYSLLDKNIAQSWTEFGMRDSSGGRGRQTPDARYETLANFFEIIRNRQATSQSAELIDKFIKNELHKFDAQSDRERHGYGPGKHTAGRVTLYFNPHDQVISSSTIQGIGWRGLCAKEIEVTRGTGVFSQRAFSQGFEVGKSETYKFWDNQHNKPEFKKQNFWHPPSPPARYSLRKGLEANENFAGKILTVLTAPIAIIGLKFFGPPINGSPPEGWETPIDAPPLPAPFVPQSVRFGNISDKFDEGFDAPGESRDKAKQYEADDPYGGVRPLPGTPKDTTDSMLTDAPKGDSASEASLRYEHHAMLRMQARRSGRYGNDTPVKEEDDLKNASEDYKKWRSDKIKYMMAAAIDTHATDHSTIMTNPDHAQKALAYDIAVGVCHIPAADLRILRTTADWRYLEALDEDDSNSGFREYFLSGLYKNKTLDSWASEPNHEASMPATIINKRAFFK